MIYHYAQKWVNNHKIQYMNYGIPFLLRICMYNSFNIFGCDVHHIGMWSKAASNNTDLNLSQYVELKNEKLHILWILYGQDNKN